MNVLITGGYGFIGSSIARKFFEEGANIFIIDNLSTGKPSNISFTHQFYHLGIEDPHCETVFESNVIDVVIHCAAQTSVQFSLANPLTDSHTNIMGLIRMLNLSKKYNVKHFIFTSSAAVYGNQGRIDIQEDLPLNPLSIYGLNKKIGEEYCLKWQEYYNLPVLIYRFANVYGPHQSLLSGAVIPVLVNKITTNAEMVIYGDGQQTRDFLFVEDVATAVVKGVKAKLCGVYNLSTNEEVTLNHLLDVIREEGYSLNVKYEEDRPGDIRHSRLNNEKIKKTLGWNAAISINEGLKRCLQQINSNQNILH
ncbi:NAD-dependent epimerase/dehydratase family protein [Lysinibacillus antri]|uniref:NAD-dependent epimerase/dehydratase family protein n=1 Tax=Lysinibacillus antri TaxID=2498145 RepID=A0A432LDL6_9BACI|nr:NAD-dependent epimerase/dehydratase family protein [Lysinibacillus antri]TSI04309.1 NAD-dependent epimerase/dehydratase family protein [Lysinibacillus sp. BW-2-10]